MPLSLLPRLDQARAWPSSSVGRDPERGGDNDSSSSPIARYQLGLNPQAGEEARVFDQAEAAASRTVQQAEGRKGRASADLDSPDDPVAFDDEATADHDGGCVKIRIDKRDVIFSKIVRLRARFNCELRGKCKGLYFPQGHGLQCCHIFSRRHQATRYDPDNALAGCFACHQYYGENPTLFAAVVKKHLGDGRYEALEARHRQIVKRTKKDADDLYSHLKEQYRALQEDPNHVVVSYD